MSAAAVLRYYEAGDRSPRIGRNVGSDPATMTGGNNVTDTDVLYVAVPPADVSSPHSPHVIEVVYRGAAGESFDPVDKIAAFHSGANAVRHRANATGPSAWTLVYVLQEAAARTI